MKLPRFLWVPFELGRPFGAPNEPAFQRRVLRTALDLMERPDGPVILEDFPDDAPTSAEEEDDGAAWACPIPFQPPSEDHPEQVAAALDEMQRLAPWHQLYVERRGISAPGASGIELDRLPRLLGQLAAGEEEPDAESAHPFQEWLRLGCDDLRTWYLEAAQGQPGRATTTELRDWFWQQTAAARLIASAATALAAHPNPLLKLLAARALVPREYHALLMPSTPPDAESAGERG